MVVDLEKRGAHVVHENTAQNSTERSWLLVQKGRVASGARLAPWTRFILSDEAQGTRAVFRAWQTRQIESQQHKLNARPRAARDGRALPSARTADPVFDGGRVPPGAWVPNRQPGSEG